jgi:hypothetical protein
MEIGLWAFLGPVAFQELVYQNGSRRFHKESQKKDFSDAVYTVPPAGRRKRNPLA